MVVKRNDLMHEQIVNRRKTGLTYAQIGRELGLSRERVRQIANHKPTAKKRPVNNDPDALLTTTQAAEILNVHLNTVRRWSNNGILEAYRIGPRCDRRIRRRDIDNLLLKRATFRTSMTAK